MSERCWNETVVEYISSFEVCCKVTENDSSYLWFFRLRFHHAFHLEMCKIHCTHLPAFGVLALDVPVSITIDDFPQFSDVVI